MLVLLLIQRDEKSHPDSHVDEICAYSSDFSAAFIPSAKLTSSISLIIKKKHRKRKRESLIQASGLGKELLTLYRLRRCKSVLYPGKLTDRFSIQNWYSWSKTGRISCRKSLFGSRQRGVGGREGE